LTGASPAEHGERPRHSRAERSKRGAGRDRRYADAKARKNYASTSPITRASGKKPIVLARYARNRLVGIPHGCLKATTAYNEQTAWSHPNTAAA
jgi:hypothetical protein